MLPPALKHLILRGFPPVLTFGFVLVLAGILPVVPAFAQSQPSSNRTQQQTQEPPPEMGGPQTEVGPIAVPKKKEEAPPPEKAKPPKNPPGMGDFSLHVDVPVVNVPVMVTTKNGQFVPGLKEQNFKIEEDGVPQKITSFAQQADAPITAVLMVEFAATNYYFMYDALNASYTFANSLKKDDWVAVEYYDMKPHVLVDFTQDKRQVFGALNTLRIPTWRETNLFDALYDTIDRLERLEGRKYIILISSGIDTFSKLTFDNALKKVKDSHDITIFAVSTGNWIRAIADSRMGSIQRMDFLQADNEMNTFARLTGGRAYFPKFQGEMPEIFGDIAGSIRNQYIISYHPSNPKQDGSWRKIKVELTDGNGGPIKIRDQKGHDIKPTIIARDGYKAKMEVE